MMLDPFTSQEMPISGMMCHYRSNQNDNAYHIPVLIPEPISSCLFRLEDGVRCTGRQPNSSHGPEKIVEQTGADPYTGFDLDYDDTLRSSAQILLGWDLYLGREIYRSNYIYLSVRSPDNRLPNNFSSPGYIMLLSPDLEDREIRGRSSSVRNTFYSAVIPTPDGPLTYEYCVLSAQSGGWGSGVNITDLFVVETTYDFPDLGTNVRQMCILTSLGNLAVVRAQVIDHSIPRGEASTLFEVDLYNPLDAQPIGKK